MGSKVEGSNRGVIECRNAACVVFFRPHSACTLNTCAKIHSTQRTIKKDKFCKKFKSNKNMLWYFNTNLYKSLFHHGRQKQKI